MCWHWQLKALKIYYVDEVFKQMFNVNGNMFNWSKTLKSLKYRFCFSMLCQINYTNLLQSVGFHNRGESEGATKGVAYLHPQQKWWWIWVKYLCWTSWLSWWSSFLRVQINIRKILELIFWGNEITGQTFHLVHSFAYIGPEYKQSCPGFLFFERLPDLNRSLRCSKSISGHCNW